MVPTLIPTFERQVESDPPAVTKLAEQTAPLTECSSGPAEPRETPIHPVHPPHTHQEEVRAPWGPQAPS